MRRRLLNSSRFNKNALVALLAIGLLLFVNVGFVAVYHLAKMRWYQQQLVSKPGEETVTLHLTKEQFYNGTKEYEWKIDGESYDMRSFTETDSGVTVIAVHDPYEHQLINILTAGFRGGNENQSTKPFQDWVKLLASPFIPVQNLLIRIFPRSTDFVFATKAFCSVLYFPELIDPPLA